MKTQTLEEAQKEIKRLQSALDYIALVAMRKDPHLGRPRTSDKTCIFCLAYFALNDGAFGESFNYEEMAKELRAEKKVEPDTTMKPSIQSFQPKK